MPEIQDLSTWHSLSAQLLAANPTTTRIVAKYTLSSQRSTSKKRKADDTISQAKSENESSVPTKRAKLTVRTYDTYSNTTLWLHTMEGKEMSQIMRILADLGISMAAKEKKVKTEEVDLAKEDDSRHVVETEIKKEDLKVIAKSEIKQHISGAGGSGKKKKKSGKK